jgi:hypothetical protein
MLLKITVEGIRAFQGTDAFFSESDGWSAAFA